MKYSILLLNGPNLNLLGTRETSIYGAITLAQIEAELAAVGKQLGVAVSSFQSNGEGALVDRIQQARTDGNDFLIINPGAYTHTSLAIRDALTGVAIPFIEVHLSNIYQREAFRHHSFVSAVAVGTIAGLGPRGYRFALEHAVEHLTGNQWPAANAN